MTHKHDEQIPLALESLVARLGDLSIALGSQVAPVLDHIRAALISAMAARDRGDVPGAITQIGAAMDELAAFADRLDPSEAMLMRALAQNFRAALRRGDEAQAKQTADVMLQKSGAVPRKQDQ